MPEDEEKAFSRTVDSFTYASAEYRSNPELLEFPDVAEDVVLADEAEVDEEVRVVEVLLEETK
jgi:hypothetical protein